MDRDEFQRRLKKEFIERCAYNGYGNVRYEERYYWNDEMRTIYKESYGYIYSVMKREEKERTNKLWTQTLDNGTLKNVFKDYGFVLKEGKVYAYDNGSLIIKAFLNKVLKEIEEVYGITGIKIHKHPTACCHDLLDWSKAELIDDKTNSTTK